MTKRIARVGTFLFAVCAVSLLFVGPGVAAHRGAKATNLVIWVDSPQKASIEKSSAAWGKAPVTVLVHSFGGIRDDLKTVKPENAPDIIIGPHDWVGDLATNGLIEPLYPSAATKQQFPGYALDAFSYGTAVKKLYGMPVQIENIALLVNTKLAKVPTTFAQLESEALAAKKKNHLSFGICVQQGSGGDAYHMYPFFSGLGGYIFGVNKAGNLNPKDVGVANPTFIKNSTLIDKWNKEGLINAKTGYSDCDSAFTKSQTPFWVTGPWAVSDIQKAGVSFKAVQVPAIAKASVPFLGVNGMMVTKYAATHNVDAAAKDLVVNYFSTPSAQTQLAAAGGRAPANLKAKAIDPILAQFGKAGQGGVPMPNIPQMSSVWSDLGQAWVRSTKGTGAMPAARSFIVAARAISYKIG